ncbi:MAG: aspartate aminotransferase [Gemmatimonadetes bacterium]|nr:aspartate aminotransferase [Gemmatimonadota bacterium]
MDGELEPLGAMRPIPYMGVIHVVAEAMKLGFYNGHPEWSNLGQGQPEVGPMEGAPERIGRIDLEPGDHAYGPIGGTDELREAVAEHYNRLYRGGSASRYTAENVSVAAGGRLVLSRVFAALGQGRLGYQIPDYTAYEDMIDYHSHRVAPILLVTHRAHGFGLPPDTLRAAVREHDLDAYLFSNPCNPTGRLVQGDDLRSFVEIAREEACTLVLDEFYSHFIYRPDGQPGAGPISAARHIEDVNRDPVVVIDGLTKCYRYPGWRVGWAVGPRDMIEVLGRAASAIDGGPGQPIQRAALAALEPERADQETRALRTVFARKRNLMLKRLSGMGLSFAHQSEGTFYLWGCIEDLPKPFDDSQAFFRRALQHKVMTVPGEFFDVNPGKQRSGPSPYRQWVRFSFGPPEDNVRMGLDRLEEMLAGS